MKLEYFTRYSKSIITSAKFNKEKIANKLDLVTREEFDVLKVIAKQQKEIINLKKNQKGKEILLVNLLI